MTEEVKLLKHGRPVAYLRCDTCGKYTRWVSSRGWCEPCEKEFAGMKKPTGLVINSDTTMHPKSDNGTPPHE